MLRRKRSVADTSSAEQQLRDLVRTSMNYQFYIDENLDLGDLSPQEAADHYLDVGWSEGRNPTPHFDTAHYATSYPDVIACGQNPFLHYLIYGKAEGRLPAPVALPKRMGWEAPVRTWPSGPAVHASQQVLFLTSGPGDEVWSEEGLDWATVESELRGLGVEPSQVVVPEGSTALVGDSSFWAEIETPHLVVVSTVQVGALHPILMQRWPATRFVYLSRGLGSSLVREAADEQKSLRLKNKADRLFNAEVATIAAFDACILGTEGDAERLKEATSKGAVVVHSFGLQVEALIECFEALIDEIGVPVQ